MKIAIALSTILIATTSFAQRTTPHKPKQTPKIAFVQLEREPCEGTCPWYKVVLRPDGKILYFGGGYVEHIGAWTATYWSMDFKNLDQALKARSFASMQSAKRFGVDMPIVNITIGYTNGRTKTVSESEMGETRKHWELAKIIDGIVASANDWKAGKTRPKGWVK